MTLAWLGCAMACLAALAGVLLAVGHVSHRRLPAGLMWAHPVAAVTALVVLWTALVRWPGPDDLTFNSGVFVITLAFVAGAFLFALRLSGLRRMPAIVIGPHALVALVGCGLLIAGLSHV